MICSPGVFRWIIEAIRPFDILKAAELFAAMGIPEDIAGRLAESDPLISVSYDGKTVIVNVREAETAKTAFIITGHSAYGTEVDRHIIDGPTQGDPQTDYETKALEFAAELSAKNGIPVDHFKVLAAI